MTISDDQTNGVAGTHPSTTTPTASKDPDAIREDIERTRNELAGTVDALQAKLDVKSQAKARLARAREQATTDTGKPRPEVVAGVGGAALFVAGLLRWRKG
jgi:hypothetical protein